MASPNVFLDTKILKNNLTGLLSGAIKFSQTHTIDPTGNNTQEMPRLVSTRDTLVMFFPSDTLKSVKVQGKDKSGKSLGQLNMNPPDKLPKADRPQNAPNPECIYHDNAWSCILPANWIQPGLKLIFTSDMGKSGALNSIDIGGETQVILQNIRIGMLTAPGPLSNNPLEKDSQLLAEDYFQKIPVSELIVGNYEPLHLKEIVLSTGVKYTEKSKDEGGVYSGDLRENIAKALVSMSIDNANYGVNCSKGGFGWQAFLAQMITVHQSWGKYQNGIIQHGLSGGNGMATIYDTVGNEFSHEIGHNYNMGHWPGGGKWSIHNTYSGWGWDRRLNRFIANFFWDRNGDEVETEGGYYHRTPPFLGVYKFNRDTMGGGHPSSQFSAYTLHTGYTQKRIQQWLEKKSVMTPSSETGYLIWDEDSKKMVAKSGELVRKIDKFGVPVVTLMGFYDPEKKLKSYIYPALHGSYGYTYKAEALKSNEFWATVTYKDGSSDKFGLENHRLNNGHMNQFHFNIPEIKEPVLIEIFSNDNQRIASRDIEKAKTQPMHFAKVGKIFSQSETENPVYEVIIENGKVVNKELIADLFKKHNRLKINITNRNWSPEIHLPDILEDGQSIEIISKSEKSSDVYHDNKKLTIKNSDVVTFSSVSRWELDDKPNTSPSFYDMPFKNDDELDEQTISGALKNYDNIKIRTWNGHWLSNIRMPKVSKSGQHISISSEANSRTRFIYGNTAIYVDKGQAQSFTSALYWDVNYGIADEGTSGTVYELPFNDRDIIEKDKIADALDLYDTVEINIKNNHWASEINIPDAIQPGKSINITSTAGWKTTVNYDGKTMVIGSNDTLTFQSFAYWSMNKSNA